MRAAAFLAFVLAFALSATSHAAPARPDHSATFAFEAPVAGSRGPLGAWSSGLDGTVALDSVVVHGGRFAARITRDSTTRARFTSFVLEVPVDFPGDSVELRGWLKLADVQGYCGLWQRQDGASGPVKFDNMSSRQLNGTRNWAEYRVVLPRDAAARKLSFGALLVGTGTLWVDDVQVLVDGWPLAQAPVLERPKTVFDTDTAFVAGSRVTLTDPGPAQVENLVLLGKVWGFLKYHHPAIVAGQRHWDFDLFRVLPDVLAARDRAGAQAAIVRWLDALGPVPACGPCASAPESPVLAPRLGWLGDRALLGDTLGARLRAIHANRGKVTEQAFVSFAFLVRNPDFRAELGYAALADVDPGYRLLALYRFWNMVEYWFPYRDVMDEDWDGVLREFVPSLLGAAKRDEYALALIRLVGRVHDTHCNLWGSLEVREPRGRRTVPVAIRFVGSDPVVTGWLNPRLGPASGLRRGDVIESIDGVPVRRLLERWRPFYAASNEPTRLRDVAHRLLSGDSLAVRLEIRRDGRRHTLTAARADADSLDYLGPYRHDHAGPAFRRLSDDVAYLKLGEAKRDSIDAWFARAAGARLLVLDDRNYPSDFPLFEIGGHLVTTATPFVKFSVGDAANPGAFRFDTTLSVAPIAPHFDGAVAILVDEVTQSSAEYHSLAFRAAPKAFVAGSTTAGADGNVSRIALPGGYSTMFSGIGVFWPDGRPTQRVGIVPDLVASPTVGGLAAGRDEVFEAAVRRALGRAPSPAELAALAADDAGAERAPGRPARPRAGRPGVRGAAPARRPH